MKEIALRYSDAKLSDLAFDANAINQKLFECVKATDFLINKTEESGIMLNGRRYSHILHKHKEIDIIISANEIDEIALEFLQNWWVAKHRYISIYKLGSWGNYIEVLTESGKLPLSYIEDIRDLREISLNLTTADAV